MQEKGLHYISQSLPILRCDAEQAEDLYHKIQVSTKLPFTDGGHVAALAHLDSLPLLKFVFHLRECLDLISSFNFFPRLRLSSTHLIKQLSSDISDSVTTIQIKKRVNVYKFLC